MLQEYFEKLQDPRQTSKVRYPLYEIIIVVICGVIAGCEGWDDIADFARVKEEWYREALGLRLESGIPSHDTLQRVFTLLDPKELEKGFRKWVGSMKKQTKEQEIVSIDGKTVRGSKNEDKNPLHMVSAWANEAQLVLGQIATEEKSNEITAVPALLKMLDIEGAIVTADAMSCQREITKVITERKADYVIGLKENQPTLHQEAVQCFQEVMQSSELYVQPKQITTHDKGHGRIETRTYDLLTEEDFSSLYPQWTNLHGFGMMRTKVLSADGTAEETHYYITSLTDVTQFAKAVRRHWGVENSLHWCLDVTFNEDLSRIRKDHSAENFAVIRHIALSALKQMDDKLSVARRRRRCAYDDCYLQKVILSIHA